MSAGGIYQVWAIAHTGDNRVRRYFGGAPQVLAEAERIARSSGDDGAVSVWIENDDGLVIWAAGHKASELMLAGHTIDEQGYVYAPTQEA